MQLIVLQDLFVLTKKYNIVTYSISWCNIFCLDYVQVLFRQDIA